MPRLKLAAVTAVVLATFPNANPAHSADAEDERTAAPEVAITHRTAVTDARETGTGYDITRLTVRHDSTHAIIKVRSAKPQTPGDGLALWFNLDGDAEPEATLTGYAHSNYELTQAKSWRSVGAPILRDCLNYEIRGRTTTVTLAPACLGETTQFNVAAYAFNIDGSHITGDYAPGRYTWN